MIDASGVVLFPFKTLAMLCGLLTIVVVSRAHARSRRAASARRAAIWVR